MKKELSSRQEEGNENMSTVPSNEVADNVLTPAPTPVQLRAMLEEMVVNDLLGPAGGAEEELITQPAAHARIALARAAGWEANHVVALAISLRLIVARASTANAFSSRTG